jgi:hypothetical protein
MRTELGLEKSVVVLDPHNPDWIEDADSGAVGRKVGPACALSAPPP